MSDPMKELMAAHPRLFRDEDPLIPSHLPPGWFALVDRLCSDIEALLGDHSRSFVVMQIKEKFGALRIYYAFDNANDSVSEPDPRPLDLLRSLTDEARERSTRICQRCGGPAMVKSHGGWMAALCDEHESKRG